MPIGVLGGAFLLSGIVFDFQRSSIYHFTATNLYYETTTTKREKLEYLDYDYDQRFYTNFLFLSGTLGHNGFLLHCMQHLEDSIANSVEDMTTHNRRILSVGVRVLRLLTLWFGRASHYVGLLL